MKKMLTRLLAAVCAAVLLTTAASALTLEQAVELLEEYYVDDLPAAAYEAETLDELFAAVGDPYTYYMDEETYQAFVGTVEGDESKVGIGVAVEYTAEGIRITTVIPGGAAEEAGLVDGDIIAAIDGVSCAPAQESDVARVAGEEGTTVELTILHADGSRENITVTRRAFTLPTTTVYLLENGLGYIDCDSFASTTGTMFASGVTQYDEEAELWLVDVRSNLGGLTNGAVEASGVFTGVGVVLYLRDGEGATYPYISFDNFLTPDPAVVLTNIYSASASEVFASAIKDYGAGIVVGGRTYGKGVAQLVLDEETNPELFDGDALKVTVYRFYSGAGNTTDSLGVFPTLLLSDAVVNDVALSLRSQEPEDGTDWLRIYLGGWYFYVDTAAAKESEEGCAALAELFSALAPNTPAGVYMDGVWVDVTAPIAAAYLEVDYTSRWFTDVATSRYQTELNALATYGVLRGTGDRQFAPKAEMTRAQLCALLAQALDRKSLSASPFSDVPDDSWYAPYVTAMYEMGLVNGVGGGKFNPEGTLTHQELAVVLGRLAEFLNISCQDMLEELDLSKVTDGDLDRFDDWARPYAWLLGMSLIDSNSGQVHSMLHTTLDKIDPQATVLREEAGAALYGVLTTLGVLKW